MASFSTCSALLLAVALATAHAQELPKKSEPLDFDFEPKLMLNDLPDVPLPSSATGADSATQPPMDVARLEGALDRARKNAAFRERLWKAGVLSKLEAEEGALKVVRLTKDLENARLEAIRREIEEQRKKATGNDAATTALPESEARLTAATEVAREATAKWEDAQRGAAEIRVQRERKLLALGAGSKSAVKRAEAALQSLTANPVP